MPNRKLESERSLFFSVLFAVIGMMFPLAFTVFAGRVA
jgi:hypothetical protein